MSLQGVVIFHGLGGDNRMCGCLLGFSNFSFCRLKVEVKQG